MGQRIFGRPLKLFIDWCSELREIRTENSRKWTLSNLRLHIFTDASEETMCIVAYLQDEKTLGLIYVIGKCLVAPIRHMTIPKLELQAAVFGVRLRKQIISEHDVKIDKIDHWNNSSTVLQWLQAAHRKNRCSLRAEQGNYWKTPVIGTRGMSIEGLRESLGLNGWEWLQRSDDNWSKPWCQENELEPEQVTCTVAKETKLDQLFDWRRYCTFNRSRNPIAYCLRFKTK